MRLYEKIESREALTVTPGKPPSLKEPQKLEALSGVYFLAEMQSSESVAPEIYGGTGVCGSELLPIYSLLSLSSVLSFSFSRSSLSSPLSLRLTPP